MSKRSKEKRLRQQREAEERLREKLDFLGVEDETEAYEIVHELATQLDERPIGYQTEGCAYKDFLNHSRDGQARVCLATYDGKYIVWIGGEDDGSGWVDDEPFEEMRLFASLEEARAAFDEIEADYRPIRDVIKEIKKEVGDDNIWLDVKYNGYGYHFNVKYKEDLIIERASDLTAEMVKDAILKYEDFVSRCAKHEIVVSSIYKKPKKWNDNERYYVFEFCFVDRAWKKEVHIPSIMQHTVRFVPDFFTDEMLGDLIAKTQQYQKTMQPVWDERERDRKAKDTFAKMHDIYHPPFSYEKAQRLFSYIEERLKSCDGTLRYTKEWLKENLENEDERMYAEVFIEENGGYCDCEVLMNASQEGVWKPRRR